MKRNVKGSGMNELLAFGNGDTARMNTLEIVEFLNDHRPEGQNN